MPHFFGQIELAILVECVDGHGRAVEAPHLDIETRTRRWLPRRIHAWRRTSPRYARRTHGHVKLVQVRIELDGREAFVGARCCFYVRDQWSVALGHVVVPRLLEVLVVRLVAQSVHFEFRAEQITKFGAKYVTAHPKTKRPNGRTRWMAQASVSVSLSCSLVYRVHSAPIIVYLHALFLSVYVDGELRHGVVSLLMVGRVDFCFVLFFFLKKNILI